MQPNAVTYLTAQTIKEFEQARKLFTDYVASLGVDLSFQHFEDELNSIDKEYNRPDGALLLAYNAGAPIACTGIRKFEAGIAELKRMYVQPAFRGHKIGVALLKQAIEVAKQLGYKKLRLDTLRNMTKAQQLYRSFGFCEIPAYCFNPLPGTIYMEKIL